MPSGFEKVVKQGDSNMPSNITERDVTHDDELKSIVVQHDSETAVLSDNEKPVACKRCSPASSFLPTKSAHHALCIALFFMYASSSSSSSATFAFTSTVVSPTSIQTFPAVRTTNLYAVPQGSDMAYIRPNIDRQMNTYSQIRQVGGLECVSDVYARNSNQSQFWFIGKLARCTGAFMCTVVV
jgi:hypothetical protein